MQKVEIFSKLKYKVLLLTYNYIAIFREVLELIIGSLNHNLNIKGQDYYLSLSQTLFVPL